MTAVTVADDHLSVDLQGIDRFWALRRRISVPLSHVRRIARTPYRTWRPAGFRLLGAELPGFLRVGSFSYRGERVFWDVHHPERSIEIELVRERFDRLIVDVEKPKETTREIQRAMGRRTARARPLQQAGSADHFEAVRHCQCWARVAAEGRNVAAGHTVEFKQAGRELRGELDAALGTGRGSDELLSLPAKSRTAGLRQAARRR
jgi:hypothetical protein